MRALSPLRATGFLALAGVVALSLGSVATAADTPVADRTEETKSALDELKSPFLAVREQGIARLSALGPAARKTVIDAFTAAPAGEREPLARVLAAEGSPESVQVLLSTLVASDQTAAGESAARGIERALIEHAEVLEASVAAWRKERGETPRILDLARLLERARIEAAFLSRKSPSGLTGYYHHQFDVLLPHREHALEICFAIFADRPVRMPGEFPAGGFRFLREPEFFVDPDDLRSMAGNAVAELVSAKDDDVVAELATIYVRYRSLPELVKGRPPIEAAIRDRVLAILYRLDEETWRREAEFRVHLLQQQDYTESAAFLLLLERYDEAIKNYEKALDGGSQARALAHYNIACAHASWSLQETESPASAEKHRDLAMDNLTTAVRAGFVDWPWMEQDRDLDPIRGDPRYAKLLASVKAEFIAPDGATPRGSTPTPPHPPAPGPGTPPPQIPDGGLPPTPPMDDSPR